MEYSVLAFKLVHQILKIREGEVVSISGVVLNEDAERAFDQLSFIEEIALTIRKAKAFPVLELTTEKLQKRFFSEISNEVLGLPVEYYSKWVENIDAFIDLGWRNNPTLFASLTDDQFYNLEHSSAKISQAVESQHKRILTLGFPTKSLADYFNVDFQEITKVYFDALNCDYQMMNLVSEKLIDFLYKKDDLKIENGDAAFSFIADMALSKSHNGNIVNEQSPFPAGILKIFPKTDFYSGTLFLETVIYDKMRFRDVKITIKENVIRAVNIPGEQKNAHRLKKYLTNTQPYLQFQIGFNTNIHSYCNYALFDCVREGGVSVLFKDNSAIDCIGFMKSASINDSDLKKIIDEVKKHG